MPRSTRDVPEEYDLVAMYVSDAAPTPGVLIAGRYLVVDKVGEGGMGIVYEAQHLVTLRKIALKVMRSDTRWTPDGVARFLREARLASSVHHPNIVEVLDAGTDEAGVPYIALEFLEGASVAQVLATQPRLPLEHAVWIAQGCLQGLAASHAKQIVHRDIKPENVFIAQDADGGYGVKILDFGISRDLADPVRGTARPITRMGRAVGTAEYMSPEQIKASPTIDLRSDLWSLGVTVYEMLAGERPFGGVNDSMVAVDIITRPLVPLCEVAEVPRAVSDVVGRALEKDPAHRFETAQEMFEALKAAVGAAAHPPKFSQLLPQVWTLERAAGVSSERLVPPSPERAEPEGMESFHPRAIPPPEMFLDGNTTTAVDVEASTEPPAEVVAETRAAETSAGVTEAAPLPQFVTVPEMLPSRAWASRRWALFALLGAMFTTLWVTTRARASRSIEAPTQQVTPTRVTAPPAIELPPVEPPAPLAAPTTPVVPEAPLVAPTEDPPSAAPQSATRVPIAARRPLPVRRPPGRGPTVNPSLSRAYDGL